ncbi:MAG: class I SAM-dependent methyltransferase [Ignavibacteria bacterium]|nr:class I SAM-dependent methyltransferase [Ignavibacteria bacterium]
MKSLEESVVTAMDGADVELFQHLPYLMQDFWELGSSPENIIELIKKYKPDFSSLRILDLGCGKGAVSIKIAAALNCNCYGVDAFGEFIEEAKLKAEEFGVKDLCKFEIGDIRKKACELQGFDVVILGSIGPVLGNYFETLSILKKVIVENGIIIIDDGYFEDESKDVHPLVQKKSEVYNQIKEAGMKILFEGIAVPEEITKSNLHFYEKLNQRSEELIHKFPHKKEIFINYLEKQREENLFLEQKITCATFVIGNN